MNADLVNAVLRRGSFKCAWCACTLETEPFLGYAADRATVCQLDLSGEDSSLVAACAACTGEFTRWWPFKMRYSAETAKRFLGRHNGVVFSGPFVDYLEQVCGPLAKRQDGKRSGLLTPFTTALARIEAQRNAPLNLVRKGRAA